MDRSIGELLVWIAIAAVGLAFIGFLGFAFMFGAADNTQVTFEAEQLSAADIIDDVTFDPPREHQSTVDRIVENGSVRSVTIDYEPFFGDAPAHQIHGDGSAEAVYVEQDGTFYRIAVSNTVDVETRRQTLELVPVNETDGDVITFEELPDVDRRVVREAYAYLERECDTDADSERAPPCWRPYSSQAANASILVPSPSEDYVSYKNQTFELVVRERTVNARAYTYRATSVANDSASFREEFVTPVSEDELTQDERELLEQAIGDGYHVQVYRHDFKSVPRDRFNSLLPKLGLPTLDSLSGAHHGSAVGYINYRGDYYRVTIEYSDTYA